MGSDDSSPGSCSDSDSSTSSSSSSSELSSHMNEELYKKTPLKKRPIIHPALLQDVKQITQAGAAKRTVIVPEKKPLKKVSKSPQKLDSAYVAEKKVKPVSKKVNQAKQGTYPKPGTNPRASASKSLKNASQQLARATTTRTDRKKTGSTKCTQLEMDDYALARELQVQEFNLRKRDVKQQGCVTLSSLP